MLADALDVALAVARAFDDVGASYFLGGSEPRATNDIDFDAIRHRSSFNVYYLPLVTKIDLFILDPRRVMEFSCRRAVSVRPDGTQLFVKSPEDTILRKL